LIFDDFCETNYLNIYRTDLCQIFEVSRSVAVDDEISFSVAQGTLPWQPIFAGFIDKIDFW